MTTQVKGETEQPIETHKILLHVLVSTGEKNEHVIDMPTDKRKAINRIEFLSKLLVAACRGKLKYLYLPNPNITYNSSHIVFIGTDILGPGDWEELIDKSFNRPIGYRIA